MVQDGIHIRVPRKLPEQVTKQISMFYQQPCSNGGVPVEWKLAKVTHIQKKGCVGNLENYRSLSFALALGKVMEQIISSAITSWVMYRMIRGSGPASSGLWPELVRLHLKLLIFDLLTARRTLKCWTKSREGSGAQVLLAEGAVRV